MNVEERARPEPVIISTSIHLRVNAYSYKNSHMLLSFYCLLIIALQRVKGFPLRSNILQHICRKNFEAYLQSKFTNIKTQKRRPVSLQECLVHENLNQVRPSNLTDGRGHRHFTATLNTSLKVSQSSVSFGQKFWGLVPTDRSAHAH